MKMFSFYCHGLGYLFRLITMSIFRAFNRFLRLDKSEGVYQDCEGNDTTGIWRAICSKIPFRKISFRKVTKHKKRNEIGSESNEMSSKSNTISFEK